MFKTKFKIKKGKHRSGYWFGIHFPNQKTGYTITLPLNCWYYRNRVKATGVNKLCGYTHTLFPRIKKYDKKYDDCIKLPFNLCYIKAMHWNSTRVGFQPNFDKFNQVNIYFYSYVHGVRHYTALTQLTIDENGVKFDVEFTHFLSDDKKPVVEVEILNIQREFISSKLKLGYSLYPYFGGIPTAPCTMLFKVFKW